MNETSRWKDAFQRCHWHFPFDNPLEKVNGVKRQWNFGMDVAFIKSVNRGGKNRRGTPELFRRCRVPNGPGIFLSSTSDGCGGGDSFWPGKNGGHVRRIFGWIFDPRGPRELPDMQPAESWILTWLTIPLRSLRFSNRESGISTCLLPFYRCKEDQSRMTYFLI